MILDKTTNIFNKTTKPHDFTPEENYITNDLNLKLSQEKSLKKTADTNPTILGSQGRSGLVDGDCISASSYNTTNLYTSSKNTGHNLKDLKADINRNCENGILRPGRKPQKSPIFGVL